MNNAQLAAELVELRTQVNILTIVGAFLTIVNFFMFMMLPYYFVEKKKR